MASSDEEGELIPDCVTDYYFVDHNNEVISFSDLPLTWNDDNIPDCSSTQIFLRGTVDSGIGVLYKKVISWKFELLYVVPEFYVLSKEKSWIKLQQPKKSFLSIISTILVTVNCLHYIRRNSEASRDDMWKYLLKTLRIYTAYGFPAYRSGVFCFLWLNKLEAFIRINPAFSDSFEVVPSESDLLAHKPLITEALNRDKDMAKSEYLATLLLHMREEYTTSNEVNQTARKSSFVVDDNDIDGDNGYDSDEDMLFDSVCSFCDNGGDILCCEGRCMRSFHPTEEAGVETSCTSLGYSDAQVEAMKTFLCKNCKYQQHQCFACGLLGSSNKSSNAEVFPCVSATCGRFYHSKCVSKLLHPGDELQAKGHEMKIADGDSFICPTHTCFTCKKGEERKFHDLQFALCRRCPKAYHRKCLPGTIVFEDDVKGIQQRAWDDLLPQRILIYCMDHKIIPHLGTPHRNHILFPGVEGRQHHHGKQLPPIEKKKLADKFLSKSVTERASMQTQFKSKKADVILGGYSSKNIAKGSLQGSRNTNVMNPQVKVSKPSIAEKKQSYLRKDEPMPSLRFKINLNDKTKNAAIAREKARTTIPLVEAETETRMMALIKRATTSFDEKEYIKKRKLLSGNSCNDMSYTVEKQITLGKVQASVKAVQAAYKMLKGGCTTMEAKAVCEPQVLRQTSKWRNNLSFYLSPFLNGVRYTSFGRHFTKLDKLKEVVDRLHWYVQEDDMVVDFCCGSNDFSVILKEKIQQMGKKCLFKNYDLIQSKNDFNFEKRDWMTVRPDELPTGSQLIMGLNPPFGIQGVQASKFVKKALCFKPKLLILIVPQETKRPDAENSPYDLIWKDEVLLAGKSFYLPGSIDANDQQLEQWNWQAPPLFMWSRQDWTSKHKKIALKHGHIYDNIYDHQKLRIDSENVGPAVSNYLMEETQDCFSDFSHIVNNCGDISRILDDIPENCGYSEGEGNRSSMQNEELQIPAADGWLYDQDSNSYYLEPSNIQKDEDGNVGHIEMPHKDVQAQIVSGWKYGQSMNSNYLEPQNIEDEGNGNVGQIVESVIGNLGGGDNFEEGELVMELSTS